MLGCWVVTRGTGVVGDTSVAEFDSGVPGGGVLSLPPTDSASGTKRAGNVLLPAFSG